MLDHDRIDISEGIDINKNSDSPECSVCLYCYFFKINFTYQPLACNGCHDFLQKPMSFDDVTIATVENVVIELIFGI